MIFCSNCKYHYNDDWGMVEECRHPSNIKTKTITTPDNYYKKGEVYNKDTYNYQPWELNSDNNCQDYEEDHSLFIGVIVFLIVMLIIVVKL